MRIKQQLSRVMAFSALASMLAACGGGGSHGGLLPGGTGGTGSGGQNDTSKKANVFMKATLPTATASSTTSKRPAYISTQGTSSLVVSVTPADPAEAAQWASTYGVSGFTVCYDIFNNGAAVTSNPNVVVTVGPPTTVSFPFPSPPGVDSFIITQYAGACSTTNPYAPPTPQAGQTAAQTIISQTAPLVLNVLPGTNNNFNTQLFACGGGTPNGPNGTCLVPGPVGSTTVTLGAQIAYVLMAGSNASLGITIPAANNVLPIKAPIREAATFTSVAANRVGFPIPVIGLDGNGDAVPYTAPTGPGLAPASGLLPHGANNTACTTIVPAITCADSITLTLSETDVTGSNHFQLELVDAKTGAIAQNPGTSVTLTQINALDTADNVTGAGVVGDQYVVLATFDGSSAAASTSATVTLNATLGGTAITAQTLTVKPQASLFTAVAAGPATGYTDSSAPYTAAADILNIPTGTAGVGAAGDGYWVTDGGTIHQVGGGAAYAVTGATTLTGETLDNNNNLTAGQILAVDNSTAGTGEQATIEASGVYVFDPVAHTSKPLAVQDATTGEYIQFAKPDSIAFVSGGYVYVFSSAAGESLISAIDLESNGAGGLAQDNTNTYYLAEFIGGLPLNQGTTNFNGLAGFDTVVSGTKLIFPSNGTSNIQSLDSATCIPVAFGSTSTTCSTTTVASGHPFVGLSVNGSGYVATDSAGQIYTISGGTATSLGLVGGAVQDGSVGVIGASPLTPLPYVTQGQTTSFFGSASVPTVPYNIPPFNTTGPVLTVVPAAFAPDTSNGGWGANGGTTKAGFGIAAIPATPIAAAGTAVTPNSYLFTDNGSLRTLVP